MVDAVALHQLVGETFRGMARSGVHEATVRGINVLAVLDNTHVQCPVEIALYVITQRHIANAYAYVVELHAHHPDAGEVVGRIDIDDFCAGFETIVPTDDGREMTVRLASAPRLEAEPPWLVDY